MPPLLHYLCCLSRTFNQPFSENNTENVLDQLSFLTFVSNAAQDGRRGQRDPRLLELFYLLGKGRKKDWHPTTTYISTPTPVLRGTRRYVALPTFGNQEEFESEGGERRSHVVQLSDLQILRAPHPGTLSVLFLCEERAVGRERKVTSRRLSGEHCGLIGV